MPHSPPVPLCRVPETTMKAVGYKTPRPISDAEALIDFETEKPSPQGRDLLVKVMAVAVNPVDTKVRRNMAPADGSIRILGFDAAGIVEAAGPDAKLFKPGAAVFSAGDLTRPGTHAESPLVDEPSPGLKPQRTATIGRAEVRNREG